MKTTIKTHNMKKLLFLLLLFTGMVNAQIVNIPDANFKAKLLAANSINQIASIETPNANGQVTTFYPIDINGDGQIQVSEAALIIYLNIDGCSIANLDGINNFTNLISLNCSNNQLANLNISGLNSLKILRCYNNQLSNINLSGLNSLNTFYCNNNQLTDLNLIGLNSLNILFCSDNQLTSLNLSSNIALTGLNCNNNQLVSLEIGNNLLLKSLECGLNFITILNLSNNTELLTLRCDVNQLTSLDLSSNLELVILTCESNQLTSLNIAGLLDLQILDFAYNQITNFTFPSPLTLSYFYCSYNNLTQIDVSKISCDNYDFSNNPNLTYINMKNGHQDGCVVLLQIGLDYICSRFLGLPNLQFICVDEGESNFWTIPGNIIMNSYCSFTPGGQFNTITGTTKLDQNSNGCDISDPIISNLKIGINDGTNSGNTFSNSSGVYSFYSSYPSLNLTPILENPIYFTASPANVAINFLNGGFGQIATQDFCITPNGIHPNLEVMLAPITPARPGFDATYQLVYKNKGNQTLSGSVNLVFDDIKIDFVSAIPAVVNLAVNALTWNYTNLLPFESRSIAVTLNVNSPVETPAVNIGDVLNFTTSITPIAGDELPADNTFTYNQTVVGSFDPNDITCLEGNSVAPSEIGNYLHYVINFENTGNFPAENVVVKTIVDPSKFDINSLQLLNTSNPVNARITGNVVEFIFEDIQLAGPGGHGHVLLKVKSKSTLVTGDNVAKSAGIYFDYNAPVDTGMATTVFQSLSNAVFEKDNSVSISPNPATSIINVNSNFNIKMIEMYDVQGRIIETHIGETKTLDISEKANGIYFLKITTEKGSKIEKVAKK